MRRAGLDTGLGLLANRLGFLSHLQADGDLTSP